MNARSLKKLAAAAVAAALPLSGSPVFAAALVERPAVAIEGLPAVPSALPGLPEAAVAAQPAAGPVGAPTATFASEQAPATGALPQAAAAEPLIEQAVSDASSPAQAKDAAGAMFGESSGLAASVVVSEPKAEARRALRRRLASAGAGLAAALAVSAPAVAHAATLAAQTEAFPSQVKWAAGVAGFLGFIFGSIRPGEYAASTFDFPGALAGGLALALAAGGLTAYFATGMTAGLVAAAVGGVMTWLRWGPSLEGKPVVMTGHEMTFQGSADVQWKLAKRAFARLGMPLPGGREGRVAPRGRTYYYGEAGMTAEHAGLLSDNYNDYLDYSPFALLLRSQAARPGEPAIVLIDDVEALVKKQVSASNGELLVGGRVIARIRDIAGLTFFHSRWPANG